MTRQPLNTGAVAELTSDVLGWVRETLVDPSIGPGDNFLDVGGHSLFANRLNNMIREKYGLKIPLQHLFEESLAEACGKAVPV